MGKCNCPAQFKDHYEPHFPSCPARPPEVGTPEWVANRKAMWDQDAQDLMARLRRYEDEHPDDATCLLPLVKALDHIEERRRVNI